MRSLLLPEGIIPALVDELVDGKKKKKLLLTFGARDSVLEFFEARIALTATFKEAKPPLTESEVELSDGLYTMKLTYGFKGMDVDLDNGTVTLPALAAHVKLKDGTPVKLR